MLGYFFGPGFAKTYGGSKAKLFKRKFVNSRFLKALQQQEKMKLAIEGVGDFSQNVPRALQPIRTVVQKAIQQVVQAGKNIAKQIWKSPAGLIYGLDVKFGTRIKHVFAHAVPDLNKKTHTVFSVPQNKILELVDEAWLKRRAPLSSTIPGAYEVYLVNMGRVIGSQGENIMRIVVKPGSTNLITAYLFK
jgi:uncharacterized iron-regulated protein